MSYNISSTVSLESVYNMFKDCGRGDQFSYDALGAIMDYLEETSDGVFDLDVIGICCEFSEYDIHGLINDYLSNDEIDNFLWDDSIPFENNEDGLENFDIDSFLEDLQYDHMVLVVDNIDCIVISQ